jgi:hypothetical protein
VQTNHNFLNWITLSHRSFRGWAGSSAVMLEGHRPGRQSLVAWTSSVDAWVDRPHYILPPLAHCLALLTASAACMDGVASLDHGAVQQVNLTACRSSWHCGAVD